MKIINVSVDEKFIDCAIDIYNDLNGVESVYFVYSPNTPLKYIKSPDVIVFNSQQELIKAINKTTCDFVILHALCLSYKHIIQIKHKIIWNSWGYDIYSDIHSPFKKAIPLSLYKPITRLFLEKNDSAQHRVISFFKAIKKNFITGLLYKIILHKVSYISTVIPPEFDLIHKRYKHIRHYPFRYIEPETENTDSTKNKEPKRIERILLGNSCDPSNNHLDILHKINDLGKTYEIFIPFSYPNNVPNYVQHILSCSTNFKNLKITFFKDFIPANEYFKTIDSCQTAIFGHVRQQAVGNVSHMLNSGKNVFLFEDSVLYSFYKKQNYKVFSIDNELTSKNIETPINSEEQEKNHQKDTARHNYRTYIKELQKFFDELSFSRQKIGTGLRFLHYLSELLLISISTRTRW